MLNTSPLYGDDVCTIPSGIESLVKHEAFWATNHEAFVTTSGKPMHWCFHTAWAYNHGLFLPLNLYIRNPVFVNCCFYFCQPNICIACVSPAESSLSSSPLQSLLLSPPLHCLDRTAPTTPCSAEMGQLNSMKPANAVHKVVEHGMLTGLLGSGSMSGYSFVLQPSQQDEYCEETQLVICFQHAMEVMQCNLSSTLLLMQPC